MVRYRWLITQGLFTRHYYARLVYGSIEALCCSIKDSARQELLVGALVNINHS